MNKKWYVNLTVWIIDTLSAVILLALAIIGALSLVNSSMAGEVKIGIAVFIVGLLATRLLERVFAHKS